MDPTFHAPPVDSDSDEEPADVARATPLRARLQWVYPAAPILAAADRERRLAALIADAQRDGATTPDAIAAHLTRMGVAVRV
jgi:hypothetical protein